MRAARVVLIVLLPVLIAAGGRTGRAGENPCARLIDNGGCVVTRAGEPILAFNQDRPLVPASILKIATAALALRILGPEHRFTTRFYQDEDGTLYIEGGGDPFLVSEDAAVIARRLVQRGLRPVSRVVIDNHLFAVSGPAPGAGESRNPYDALITATAVNFNTVAVEVSPNGAVHSAEPQTPDLPLMATLALGRSPGRARLAVSRDPGRAMRLTGELFIAFIRRATPAGTTLVPGPVPIVQGRVPAALTPLLRHRSLRPLRAVLAAMLTFSNNFIANTLFLDCAATRRHAPATWDTARRVMTDFLVNDLGIAQGAIAISDGAGLSRANRVTCAAMIGILQAFRPHRGLLPRKKGLRLKSGTLTGVYSYAGYLPPGDPFVFIMNQPANRRDALLKAIRGLAAPSAPRRHPTPTS